MTFRKHIKPSVRSLTAYTVRSTAMSPDLIKLNQNENPFDLPEDLKQSLIERLLRMPWNRYPDVLPAELHRALAADLGVSEESIIAANGSNELMYTIMMAVVGKGVKVLIPTPTFFLYEKIVTVMDGQVIAVPAKTDLTFDVEAIIAAAVRERPALIVLNSPNSPTGQMLGLSDVERIINATDAVVLVDEAYIEFAEMPSVLPLLQTYDRLIILRTFSKAGSIAGLRIGYLIAQPGLCSELLKPKIPFTVNVFASAVAIELLKRKDLLADRIEKVKLQKELLYRELSALNGVRTFSSQTNFLIFQVMNNAAGLFNALLADHVLIRDVGNYPQLERTLRVNAGTEAETQAFLRSLKLHLHLTGVR